MRFLYICFVNFLSFTSLHIRSTQTCPIFSITSFSAPQDFTGVCLCWFRLSGCHVPTYFYCCVTLLIVGKSAQSRVHPLVLLMSMAIRSHTKTNYHQVACLLIYLLLYVKKKALLYHLVTNPLAVSIKTTPAIFLQRYLFELGLEEHEHL